MSEPKAIKFSVADEGRFDGVLRKSANLSVREAKDCIKSGALTVNGHVVRKPSFLVYPGDEVCGVWTETEKQTKAPEKPTKPIPERLPLQVLYEDDFLFAIYKPPGLLSVPTTHTKDRSAADEVKDHLAAEGARYKVYAVHRLDRDASGVLLFAKGFEVRGKLMEQFKKRKVEKTYLALIAGSVEEDRQQGAIEIAIDDHRYHPKVLPHQGKHARTEYQVLEQHADYALLRATTRSGRRHQVRVHLAEALAPIVGDRLYGREMAKTRLMLHGESLAFFHPYSGERLKFTCVLPADFSQVMSNLEINLP